MQHPVKISTAKTLGLNILTWEKDSHGLYDYEATKQIKDYFQIQGPCKLFRNWLTAETKIISNDKIKRGQLPEESYSFVASILLRHNGNVDTFVMGCPQRPSQELLKKEGSSEESGPINPNVYLAVRYYRLSRHGYPLSVGNIVKLGRVQYRVVEIGGGKLHNGKKQEHFIGEFNGVHNASARILGTCKFCLCDENTDDNFLISPCKCSGSCQSVHALCLKQWIDSKVKKEVNGLVVSYNFTKFECEICKDPFPRFVVRDDFKLEMITIEKPAKAYIILEGINERKESKEERCLHVICPEQNTSVKMGRGHQCEIRLQDISVSRNHSEIKNVDDVFYLSDSHSKFGTLVKLDSPIELNTKIKLQVGRSLLQFNLQ